MSSFHNDAQLNDTDFGSRVTRECWTYGMHMDDYVEYWQNERPLYLRKHPKNKNRTIEFYSRQCDEEQFIENHTVNVISILFTQVMHPKGFLLNRESSKVRHLSNLIMNEECFKV